jgi:hypothetical protein
MANLTVPNTGPVIQPEETGCSSRSSASVPTGSATAPGTASDSPTVRAVATAHGATVTATARLDGGLEVDVSVAART